MSQTPNVKVKVYDAGTLLGPRLVAGPTKRIAVYSKRFRSDVVVVLTNLPFYYEPGNLLLLEDCFAELCDEKDKHSWADDQENVRVLTGDGREGYIFLHFWQGALVPIINTDKEEGKK